MYLSKDTKAKLKLWEELPEGIISPITFPRATQSLDTDALDKGIGIYFQGKLLSDPVPDRHLCRSELFTLDRALDLLQVKILPGNLVWRIDNNPVLVAIKNQGSTHSWQLSCLTVEFC